MKKKICVEFKNILEKTNLCLFLSINAFALISCHLAVLISVNVQPEWKYINVLVYKNLAQYPQETPFNFQTQVVYDVDKAITFSEKAKSLGKPILMGIMPLKSVKMARNMKDQVEGIDISDEILFSMEKEDKTGIDIACNIIRDIYQYVDGIRIMALGDVKGTNQIIEFVRKLVAES